MRIPSHRRLFGMLGGRDRQDRWWRGAPGRSGDVRGHPGGIGAGVAAHVLVGVGGQQQHGTKPRVRVPGSQQPVAGAAARAAGIGQEIPAQLGWEASVRGLQRLAPYRGGVVSPLRRRVELVATTYADELSFRSLTEISAITADQHVRIIGGQMAALLLTAFPVPGIALRRTRDADAAITTELAGFWKSLTSTRPRRLVAGGFTRPRRGPRAEMPPCTCTPWPDAAEVSPILTCRQVGSACSLPPWLADPAEPGGSGTQDDHADRLP